MATKTKVLNLGEDHWIPPAPLNDDYPNKFNLSCIQSKEELLQVLLKYRKENNTFPLMGFDTETTGLNPEEDSIVGYSFGFNEIDAYYVPVNHKSFGLGKEVLDLIYEVMCKSDLVLMYNARFDIRMMEWHLFENESVEFKNNFILTNKPFFQYDMSKVNTYCVQVLVWSTYTKKYMPKLKAAEQHLLGWRSTTFEETVTKKPKKETGVDINVHNFAYLDPLDFDTYAYAATDALALILIYNKLKWMREEGKLSLQMHANLRMLPFTRFEQTPIQLDTNLLKKQSVHYHTELSEVENRVYNIVGYKFNISSAIERAKAFKTANIVLTEKTNSGSLATSVSVLEKVKQQFDKESEQYILISLCSEYLHIKKMLSTYIDNVLEQIDGHPYRDGLFRYSYRNTSTTSGRLSGGSGWD